MDLEGEPTIQHRRGGLSASATRGAGRMRTLVLTWRNEFRPELHKEGYSQLTYQLEQHGDMVKLMLTHEIDWPESKFIEAVSQGWPAILSSLKSLLETGESLEATRRWPENMK
jgi:hypothetical protein